MLLGSGGEGGAFDIHIQKVIKGEEKQQHQKMWLFVKMHFFCDLFLKKGSGSVSILQNQKIEEKKNPILWDFLYTTLQQLGMGRSFFFFSKKKKNLTHKTTNCKLANVSTFPRTENTQSREGFAFYQISPPPLHS